MKQTTRFEVISREITLSRADDQHTLNLLHKPLPSSPEPWWQHPAGLSYKVAAEFEASPGDFVRIVIEREGA